jgi:small subunit ribosomal protein S16
MVVIRLSPIGKKGENLYKIGVSLGRKKLTGKYLEKIGVYQAAKDLVFLKQDRLDAWLKTGAQLSDRVKNILKFAKPMPLHEAPTFVKREMTPQPPANRLQKPTPRQNPNNQGRRGGPGGGGSQSQGGRSSNTQGGAKASAATTNKASQ